MTFYEEMRDIATEVLTEFDQSRGTGAVNDGLWYVKLTPGNGPIDNPGQPVPQRTKLAAASRGVAFKYVNNSTIVASDLQLTAAVIAGLEPDITGMIEADGVRHKIVAVKPIPPTGVTVANVIIFRK